ncbi:MAG: RluA family pseudouridine synthase [Clostridia bacterium]|nr:RluA family pseudouridine synthase [Clostridia bacterium]
MRQLTAIAAEKDAGRQVKYFVRGDMGVSFGQFATLKRQDGLRVNGAPVHADYRLCPGDVVTVRLMDGTGGKSVAPEDMPVNVVYEDEDLILIDKPAPLACQCSPKQPQRTLENRLAFRYRDQPGFVFRPLNRLDKGTSGLMAAAMNAHAAQRLQKQLHTDAFVREYLAVVEGRMMGAGVIDAPIKKEAAATVRHVVDFENGQRAVTHYRVLASGEARSLVRLRLETGRTHQIRVHLSHLGHPIVGDFLYGTEDARLPGRFALHSTYIRLVHPVTGQVVEGQSPLPEGLMADADILGATVTVTMDRPLGSRHPSHPDMIYPVNYGFIRGLPAADGEDQDAYVLGPEAPLEALTGRVAAIVRRRDDAEDKWVVCPAGCSPDAASIMEQIRFQEQYFDSTVVMPNR